MSAAVTDRAVRRASVAASISLVLMVVATAAYIGWPRVAGAIGIKPAAPPPAYAAGQQIDVPAAWYASATPTLVLFARASCAACEKAQPFLKDLVGRLDDRATAVMGHPPDATGADGAFARGLGIAETSTFVVPAGLRVRSTPTLVLVTPQGTILHAWEGVGAPERQTEIVKAVDAALR